MRILLVDDSRSVAAVFSARLIADGHHVVVVENGMLAVEQFGEQPPDLVLMDIEMPLMDGFEATSRIRQIEQSRQWAWTPIIFLTSVDTPENFVLSVQSGGDDLIAKSVPESVLRAKLVAMERVAQLRHELIEANRKMERDIAARRVVEAELSRRCDELTELNRQLCQLQAQLIQKEKMASVGRLAAGVAHEINTPMAFVLSNLGTLGRYLECLITALGEYEAAHDAGRSPDPGLIAQVDANFIKDDAPQLINESREGIARVSQIIQSLKEFSRLDVCEEWMCADLNKGLEESLLLMGGALPQNIQVIKLYGDLPPVECLPGQINQVFMSLLINAVQAIESSPGSVTIRSGSEGDSVWVEVVDTGCGIPETDLSRIFDPFFSTRPIGQGSGLGLSMAYGIVRNHGGTIEVESTPGQGSCFRLSSQ